MGAAGGSETCMAALRRRARRARIGADIDRELPGLTDGERRRVLEQRLREHAAIEAEGLAWRQEQARAERARCDAVRVAAAEQAARECQAAAAADVVRQALACEDCGRGRPAGLCEACDHRRQTEALIGEAGLLAASGSADLSDAGSIAACVAGARTAIGDSVAAWQELLGITGVAALEADSAGRFGRVRVHRVAGRAAGRRRVPGRRPGGAGPYAGGRSRGPASVPVRAGGPWFRHNPTGADAVAAATKAVGTARERVAEYLLGTRLEQLHERSAGPVRGPASGTERPPGLAARPLDGAPGGAG